MNNRRSYIEANKEKKIRDLFNATDSFSLPRPSFLNKNLTDELLFENPNIPHRSESSEEDSIKYRYNLLSDLETTNNIIKAEREEYYNKHRSYLNNFASVERRFKQLEYDANRQILLMLNDDPFSYGVTEHFNTIDFVDLERSDTEILRGKVNLGYKEYKTIDLNIKNISTRISCVDGVLQEVKELNSINNIRSKDGSFFKVKAETNNVKSIVTLELFIELATEESIDKLEIAYKAINANAKESMSVSYSKDGSSYLYPDLEDLISVGMNSTIVDIYDTDIKYIKIRIQKFAADTSNNFINEYLFLIDYIGGIDYTYVSESTYYSEAYEIFDTEDNPVDFSLATIRTGTCCITPNETSISFFLSKDGENYIPINYYGESNTVVQFKNSINTDIFALEDETKNDVFRELGERHSRLNRYLPDGIDIIENSIEIKKGLYKWELIDDNYCCVIEIDNIEGRYFDIKDTECFINGAKKTGIFFLAKGRYEVKTATANYSVIDTKNLSSETILKIRDARYPKNHKYIFEGLRYPSDFEGNKIYNGADNLYTYYLNKVSKAEFELDNSPNNIFYSEYREGYGTVFYVKSSINTDEEVYISCNLNENIANNKVYIKAILRSSNTFKSPKIDSIQVRVI